MAYGAYLSRKSKLMRDFDKMAARIKPGLLSRYGEEQIQDLIRESRQEYEALIPQIPFIGEKSPFLIFLLPTSRYLAVYRVLRRQHRPVEEAGEMIYEMNEAELKAIPWYARRTIGFLWFSRWFKRRLKIRAKESQERRYPEGYVLNYVTGDGQTFDYGIDYTECGGWKFLQAQDAQALAPYVCAMDKTASELLGWGLIRTTTLAQGGEKCDFRFKKGGKTRVALPPSLKPDDKPNTTSPS